MNSEQVSNEKEEHFSQRSDKTSGLPQESVKGTKSAVEIETPNGVITASKTTVGGPKETPKTRKYNNLESMMRDDRGNLTYMEHAVNISKELSNFVKSKSNIHSDAKTLTLRVERAIFNASKEFTELRERVALLELELKKLNASKTQDGSQEVKKVTGLNKERSERKPATPASSKRGRSSPVSAEKSASSKKSRSATNPRGQENEWKTVETRKKSMKTRPGNDRAPKTIRPKSDAIMVGAKEGVLYADILKRMKEDPSLKDLGKVVSRVRKTRNGEVLLEFSADAKTKSAEFKKAVETVLGQDATVKALTQEVTMECRYLDEITTADELRIALKEQYALGDGQSDFPIRMRKAYGDTQIASFSLPVEAANEMLKNGKIKVGWSVCQLKVAQQLTRCYKCSGFGHLAKGCKGTDRSKACWKCGTEGHQAKECKQAAKCLLCSETDGNNHATGSSRCKAYKEAAAKRGWK